MNPPEIQTLEPELTTVAPEYAVVHVGAQVRRYDGLEADHNYELDGFEFRTLPARGELLTTFATVNDLHFGETEAGAIAGSDIGPILRVEPGEEPYPELMNRAATEEIDLLDPEAVIAKGDLVGGLEPRVDYERFLACYGERFAGRLWHVRGNHDSSHGGDFAAFPYQRIDVNGAVVALIDTAIVDRPNGRVPAETIDWLDALAAEVDVPMLVMGHHHCWNPDLDKRSDTFYGINPADSEALIEVARRRSAIVGYFAGHTHRNRRQRFTATGEVPWVEVASVKDYPGTWAEYRVYEGGICQIHHRISSPAALEWSNRSRAMYEGLFADYAFGGLDDRCFALPVRV